jgi:hypothetical protein
MVNKEDVQKVTTVLGFTRCKINWKLRRTVGDTMYQVGELFWLEWTCELQRTVGDTMYQVGELFWLVWTCELQRTAGKQPNYVIVAYLFV